MIITVKYLCKYRLNFAKNYVFSGDKSKCNKDCPYYKVSGKSKICDFRGKLMNFGKQLKFKVK